MSSRTARSNNGCLTNSRILHMVRGMMEAEDNTLGPDDCKAHSPWHRRKTQTLSSC